jgi:hypothetical protein
MLLSFARQGIDTAPKSNQPLVEIRMFFLGCGFIFAIHSV